MQISPPSFFVCAGLFLAFALPARADSLTLTSGEVLSGRISSESAQEIVMDVQVGSGIIEQKTFLKSEVKSVTKTPADEIAFQAIKNYQIESHSLPPASYPVIIQNFQTFLKQHAKSAHAAEIKKNLEAFNQEQERVKKGDIKWENQWYTREEAEKNKVELGAKIRLSFMKEQVTKRDLIGALNTFELIEKSSPGARVFPDAAELGQAVIRALVLDADRLQNAAKEQETKFTASLKLATEKQKAQLSDARRLQLEAAEAAASAAEQAASGVKWKPFFPTAPKSLEGQKNRLTAEVPRFERLPVAEMRASIAALDAAESALQLKKADEAEAKIKDAQTRWPQNGRLTGIKSDLDALREELKPKPTPTPTPTPQPTPSPKPDRKGRPNRPAEAAAPSPKP